MEEEVKKRRKKSTREGLRPFYGAGLTAFIVIAAAIIFYLSISRIPSIIGAVKKILHYTEPIWFGFIIAYIIAPSVRYLERKLRPVCRKYVKKKESADKLAESLGVFLGLALWITLIIVLIIMIIPQLTENISNLINIMPDQIKSVSSAITSFMEKTGMETDGITNITNQILDNFNKWVETDLLKNLNVWFSQFTAGMFSVVKSAFNVIIGIIVAIYVLTGRQTFKRQLKQIIYALFSEKHAQMLIDTLHESNYIFTGFITGKLVDSLIIGLICFVCLWILRMPYVLLISVIVGVTNIIPFFGPYMGAIPSTLLIFLQNPVQGVIFLIFILILQQVDGNIIGPKILGESTGLSAFWVVFSILLFGGLFGVVGMLFGVPVFAVVYRILANCIDYLLRKKGRDDIADLSKKEKMAEKKASS